MLHPDNRSETRQSPKPPKSSYQLDLLEEKRAFVVIALTDKLSQAAKLVAQNALAHYHSERGYSWPSLPKIAEECGFSPQSTKTIARAFDELEASGAFKIVRGASKNGGRASGPKITHKCCPNMQWFRDEYARLRGRTATSRDHDLFADLRDTNAQRLDMDSQLDAKRFSAGFDTVEDPVGQCSKPNKENKTNRTNRKAPNEDAFSALVPHKSRSATNLCANDNTRPEDRYEMGSKGDPWPADYREQFWNRYPSKPGDSRKVGLAELDSIRASNRVEFSSIMNGLEHFAERMNARVKLHPHERRYIAAAAVWLREARWETERATSVEDRHAAQKARVKVAI